MANNRVRLHKSHLDYFRKLSRNTGNEIQAFLIGEVVNTSLTVVHSFEYPPEYAVSTPNEVAWSVEDYEDMRRRCERGNRRVVGCIHSHPEWDAVLSPADYDFTVTAGFRICGICSTQGRKTRPRFWVMDSALPCTIEYYAKEKSNKGKEN